MGIVDRTYDYESRALRCSKVSIEDHSTELRFESTEGEEVIIILPNQHPMFCHNSQYRIIIHLEEK